MLASGQPERKLAGRGRHRDVSMLAEQRAAWKALRQPEPAAYQAVVAMIDLGIYLKCSKLQSTELGPKTRRSTCDENVGPIWTTAAANMNLIRVNVGGEDDKT